MNKISPIIAYCILKWSEFTTLNTKNKKIYLEFQDEISHFSHNIFVHNEERHMY